MFCLALFVVTFWLSPKCHCLDVASIDGARSTGSHGAVDPSAFSASVGPSKHLEGVYASFVLHSLISGIAEEYQGRLHTKQELGREDRKQLLDHIYDKVGTMYKEECESRGLQPPKNVSSIPVREELLDSRYFAAYAFAAYSIVWDMIRNPKAFYRYQDRIGGRMFDAASQYIPLDPSFDPEDIKGMRKSLPKILTQYAKLGLASEAGAQFQKGTDKRWQDGGPVTFKVWIDSPIFWEYVERLRLTSTEFKDWSFFIVQRFFSSFLVEAEMISESPSDDSPGRIVQEWRIEAM